MKVVHVLKRIEMIDNDIKDLRKLEKSIAKDKSFSTPIYMSIEKQINILLGERIKMLELKIENPPENLVEEIEGREPVKTAKQKKAAAPRKPRAKQAAPKTAKTGLDVDNDDSDMMMLTQDLIDAKIQKMQSTSVNPVETKKTSDESPTKEEILSKSSTEASEDDEYVKLLDVALEKGTLKKQGLEKEKKVRFFRENFPVE